MFVVAFDSKTFQSGASLDTAVLMDAPDGYDADAQMTTIKKGTTQTVQVAYVLTDESSPVTVEVSDLFALDDTVKVTREFTL